MALSTDQEGIAMKAFNLSVPDGTEDLIGVPEVIEMIPDALKLLTDEVATRKEWYRLQESNMVVTVTNGLGILDDDVMAESLTDSEGGFITFTRSDSANQPANTLKFLPDTSKLMRPRPGGDSIVYYTIRGASGKGLIYVYSGYGVACTGVALATGKAYLTFATCPGQLEDELVALLANMVKDRLNAMNRQQTMNAPDPAEGTNGNQS